MKFDHEWFSVSFTITTYQAVQRNAADYATVLLYTMKNEFDLNPDEVQKIQNSLIILLKMCHKNVFLFNFLNTLVFYRLIKHSEVNAYTGVVLCY